MDIAGTDPFSMAHDSGREPHAPLAEDLDVDVAVIGAGIVGVAAAHELAEAGLSVALLEARTVCSGVTGNSTAKLSALHGMIYRALCKPHGDEAARLRRAQPLGAGGVLRDRRAPLDRVPARAHAPPSPTARTRASAARSGRGRGRAPRASRPPSPRRPTCPSPSPPRSGSTSRRSSTRSPGRAGSPRRSRARGPGFRAHPRALGVRGRGRSCVSASRTAARCGPSTSSSRRTCRSSTAASTSPAAARSAPTPSPAPPAVRSRRGCT